MSLLGITCSSEQSLVLFGSLATGNLVVTLLLTKMYRWFPRFKYQSFFVWASLLAVDKIKRRDSFPADKSLQSLHDRLTPLGRDFAIGFNLILFAMIYGFTIPVAICG